MGKYYCNPMNLEYRYQFVQQRNAENNTEKVLVYREAADPSIVLFHDKYYLFPSMTAGFWSSKDMEQWYYHKFLSDMPIYDYAPDVRVVGEYLYFCASKVGEVCSFYRTKNPEKEPFEEIKGTFSFHDPNLFQDDDGRLYFYWGCSNTNPIMGVELESNSMQPISDPVKLFDSDYENRGYERIGTDHISRQNGEEVSAMVSSMIQHLQDMPEEVKEKWGIKTNSEIEKLAWSMAGDKPFIEGAWMTKHNGIYYLQYAIPGTEYNIYGDGVYISETPLGPFRPAVNNPYSYKPGGYMRGAGHGSTLEDKNGQVWHISTMGICRNHPMERRLGLWKAGFDADGELYCDQRYGDWPVNMQAKAFEKPEWMLLSYKARVTASSGNGMDYVTDEDCQTWWIAGSKEPGAWLIIDLGEIKKIHAVQINFMDESIESNMPGTAQCQPDGALRFIDTEGQNTRWVLEGSKDGTTYEMLMDKSKTNTDLAHDFIVWESGIQKRFLRLTILELPYGKIPAVSGIRVFGHGEGSLPEKTEGVLVKRKNALDMVVSWDKDSAVGHNILWGGGQRQINYITAIWYWGKTKSR